MELACGPDGSARLVRPELVEQSTPKREVSSGRQQKPDAGFFVTDFQACEVNAPIVSSKNLPASPTRTSASASEFMNKLKRIALHVLCALRDSHWRWHLAGVRRELHGA